MGVTYLKEHQIATTGAIFKAGHSVKFITVQTKLAIRTVQRQVKKLWKPKQWNRPTQTFMSRCYQKHIVLTYLYTKHIGTMLMVSSLYNNTLVCVIIFGNI